MVVTLIIAIIFCIWFFFTIINQFNIERFAILNQLDHFSIIPSWSFFAPHPGTTDYHLFYHDRYSDGRLSSLREVSFISRRHWYHLFWNPEKRIQKILFDGFMTLIRLAPKLESTELKFTIPYLLILNYISSINRSNLECATQFIIVETFGYITESQPRIVMISEFHSLR